MGAKAQLHFILCGVFSLVGIVLLVMAIMGKSGAAKSLEEAKTKLEASTKAPLPTLGDLEGARTRQTAFQQEVGEFENKLRTDVGDRLRAFTKTYTTTPQFYADEWVPKSKDYSKRLEALRQDPPIPARLRKAADDSNPNAREFSNLPNQQKFWDDHDKTMNALPPANIVTAQSQLKAMNEVITVLEKLRASDQYKDSVFIFERFDLQSFTGEAAREPNLPWARREFSTVMWCDPSFALAFAEEMCRPSDKTKGDDKDATRRAFLPMEVVQFTAEMVGRPHDVQFIVSNADREVWSIAAGLTQEEFNETTKQREVADKLSKEERMPMPFRYVIRLQALELNKAWTAIAVKP